MQHARLNLAVLNMTQPSLNAVFVRKIVEQVKDMGVKPSLFLLDREFYSTDVIRMPDSMGVWYPIPEVNTGPVKTALEHHAYTGSKKVSKMSISNTEKISASYYGIIVPRKRISKKKMEKKAGAPEDRYIAFATNASRMDVGEYSKRWTIETCYRLVENARTKSCGSNRPARLFCFLYSLTLFNAWVLVNAQLASFLKLRDGVLPVTQMYMKIATLMAIYRNIAIQPEPPPDPVAP